MKALRVPGLLFALPGVIITLMPGGSSALVLDRTALAAGQWWRLWTGHWVHFSASHLTWNLAVILVVGSLLERIRPGRLLRFTLLAAPLISATILVGEPDLAAYGGLSGLATGLTALLALTKLEQSSEETAFGGGLLLLVAVKSGFDAVSHQPIFSHFAGAGIQVSPTAHLGGFATALLYCAPSWGIRHGASGGIGRRGVAGRRHE